MSNEQDSQPLDGIALNPAYRSKIESLLMALLQATEDGILMSALDRADIVANRRLGELFDIPPEEVVVSDPETVRRRIASLLPDPKAFEEQVAEIYADPNRVHTDEIELRTTPPRILRRFTGPVRDTQGEIFGRVWTFLDITQTRQLQNELNARLEARIRDHAETSDALRAMNEVSRIAMQRIETDALLSQLVTQVAAPMGQECAAILLLSRDGKQLEGIAAPVERPLRALSLTLSQDAALAACVQGAAQTEGERFQTYPDYRGTLARLLRARALRVAPLLSGAKILGALVFGTRAPLLELTPQRRAHLEAIADQIALAIQTHRYQSELLTTLETLRATQTRMVEIEKLRMAGTMAASVARDIRNILTTIQVEMAAVPVEVTESLHVHIHRFTTLTHRLLAFERPGVLETRPTSLTEVVRRIVPILEAQAQINGVEIVLRMPDDLPLVSADASQMENLFVNLCLNALQAMSERGGTLTLEGTACEEWLGITVEDTGCGIAPEHQQRLFDPFFTTRATGFGLGLFSCKRIVEEHGGQLTVESAPGKGSRFQVLLPVVTFR
jgi:signal transduction histidine kinase